MDEISLQTNPKGHIVWVIPKENLDQSSQMAVMSDSVAGSSNIDSDVQVETR